VRRILVVVLAGALLLGLLLGSGELPGRRHEARADTGKGIHKIRHVVIITQENRSFDSYFGTYPGADGIPMKNGEPTVCNPDPKTHECVEPYHDTSDRNAGGPHDTVNAIRDIHGGRMDGFQLEARKGRFLACHATDNPGCSLTPSKPDVMGYHDWHEIPNYWDYARNFVLQDHMFEADNSWSLPAHLALVSGWTARCSRHGDPMSCKSTLTAPFGATGHGKPVDYPWTDLTWLLHRYHVSWRYYVAKGGKPDCAAARCSARSRPRARRPRASGTRSRASTPCARTTSWATSSRCATSTAPPAGGSSRRSRGSRRRRRRASILRRS
jgi:phospholipase C